MATQEDVETLLHTQLNNDARSQTLAAGPQWKTFQMGFFYGDEISVDLGVKATMLTLLTLEHKLLAGEHWEKLRVSIDRATFAEQAITTITEIATAAT